MNCEIHNFVIKKGGFVKKIVRTNRGIGYDGKYLIKYIA